MPPEIHKPIERQNPSTAPSGENIRQKLFDDTHSGKTLGKFGMDGNKACPTEPKEGTVPGLLPGHAAKDCKFIGMKDLPKGMHSLDIPELYNKTAQSTVRFDQDVKGFVSPTKMKTAKDVTEGTGVMIGKDGNSCLVATDNHVVDSTPDHRILKNTGVTADGSKYPVEVRYKDKGTDTAVVALNTGADTDKVCKPIQVSDDVAKDGKKGAPVAGFGFAQGSKALYVSPGESNGLVSLKDRLSPDEIKAQGIPKDTKQLELRKYHMVGGQSGGPVVSADGKLLGLNDQSPEGSTREGLAVKLDRKRVEELIEKSKKKSN